MVKLYVGFGVLAWCLVACGAPNLTFAEEPTDAGTGGQSSDTSTTTTPDGESTTDDGSVDSLASPDGTGSVDGAGNVDSAEIADSSDGATQPDGFVDVTSCIDHVQDGNESDVDCGGPMCPRCPAGSQCKEDIDCISSFCENGQCAMASCVDQVKNLRETDIDCGGPDCPPCALGKDCQQFTDCVGQSCTAGKCQSFSCSDNFRGLGETDVDCGGGSCAGCPAGKHCVLPRDCASGFCEADQICAAPTCADAVKNGTETDKDCGGASCNPCMDGLACAVPADCASGVCAGQLCQAPTCADTVTNGTETAPDCGGACARCPAKATCQQDGDCLSGYCAGTCQACPKDAVPVPTADGTSAYCVDSTEVTVTAYSQFLLSNPSVNALPNGCSAKASLQPNIALDLTVPNNPVTSVDWCDAFAYCAYRGKHLCGRIGGGPTLASGESTDKNKSEWYNACSKGGAQQYPYLGPFTRNRCIDDRTRAVRNVAFATTCIGGYSGLYDMSGNVAEWEDACNGATSLTDQCHVRGGSYNDTGQALACTASAQSRRSNTDPAIGFRCCF